MKQQGPEQRHWVIIPAAGVGQRMQSDRPKQYLSLANKTVLERTIARFQSRPEFQAVVVGIASHDSFWSALPCSGWNRVASFIGGEEREDTVRAGLDYLSDKAQDGDWIWVHDAARPCLRDADLDRMFAKLAEAPVDGILLAAPVHDTVKRADSSALVQSTVDRTGLWRALTPQVFRYAALKNALGICRNQGLTVTDEASAVEQAGGKPELVEATGRNLKITCPGDLELAMQELNEGNTGAPRIGNGFDVHAFEPGDHVVLGGVRIPFEKGLKAHSDGDVVLHALMDAMLGALALGDIGRHFPDTDEKWKGADSRALLRAVREMIAQRGFRVGNLDLTVIAEKPKLARHVPDMQRCIAEDLNLKESDVGLKATTSEKLGFTGRGEGIACQAAVLLLPEVLA